MTGAMRRPRVAVVALGFALLMGASWGDSGFAGGGDGVGCSITVDR